MSELTKETVELIISRAERYVKLASNAVDSLKKAQSYGTPPAVVAVELERIDKLRQDAAAAMYLARLAQSEFAAQSAK